MEANLDEIIKDAVCFLQAAKEIKNGAVKNNLLGLAKLRVEQAEQIAFSQQTK